MSHLLLSLLACAPDLTPSWAYDPIWIESAEGDGVHGFETWQVYGPKWPSHYNDKYYVCSVVMELDGVPVACDAEPECTWAWEVTSALAQSDCAAGLDQDPLFHSLQRIALGSLSTAAEAPWPGSTSVGWSDYGNGWEVHGDAYPEVLDLGGQVSSAEWDGTEPFLMVPTSSFAIEP